MKHELHELYRYDNEIYTLEALSKVIGQDLTQMKPIQRHRLGLNKFHRVCNYNTPSKASFEYITIEGVKIGWQFGEQTFFDTEEERDAMRAEYQKIREESKRRTQLLNRLAELDTDTLEKLINSL